MPSRRSPDYARASAAGGRFLLRIEDIDRTRCRPEYETAIYDDLAWLGLAWEKPVRRQSEHMDDYAAALGRLTAMGLVYPGFLSRSEIAAAGTQRDPGRRAALSRHRPRPDAGRYRIAHRLGRALCGCASAWIAPSPWPDRCPGARTTRRSPPIPPPGATSSSRARKRRPRINLAVVVDDAAQGITNVVRGRDLYAATSVHALLQKLLGLPSPAYSPTTA